tara:strand:+ start:187 stop:1764 length:1578 start_codon:yes stop_codon:yes gene_type:complete
MALKVYINPIYNWRKSKTKLGYLFYKGEVENFQDFEKENFDLREIINFLNQQNNHFSFIYQNNNRIIAAVDTIRSYPIFFSKTNSDFIFSNSAETIREKINIFQPNELGLKEFQMLGYTLKSKTLIQQISQISAGKFIDSKNYKNIQTYFSYLGRPKKKLKSTWISLLNSELNSIFKKTVSKSKNRQILLPLSGGYDSRLILAKLIEFNFKNVTCFSYGLKNNFETKTARKVCKSLNLDLLELESEKLNDSSLLSKKITKDYIKFATNLCSSPSLIDFYAIKYLKEKKIINKNSILINGQSGDFITGGHIPIVDKKNLNEKKLFEIIFNKHYSLWKDLKEVNYDVMYENFKQELKNTNFKSGVKNENFFFSQHEYWEWIERQTKWVVNGQRVYDFFGLDWMLPLWEKSFIKFWMKVPYELKFKQKLYKEYLQNYNYLNIFSIPKAVPIPWTGLRKLIPILVNTFSLFDQKKKQTLYSKFYYYSTNKYLYEYFGKQNYFQMSKFSRSPQSFIAKSVLDDIKKRLKF